jgi:REP element-mobilizing transposase RayT
LPGGVFHVVSRFARDEWWLDGEGARAAYLGLVGEAAGVDDAQVLAYCLMSNHVHLVVVQGEAALSRFMKSVHTGFAAWAHRSRRRGKAQGPVFAGRPRMVLVEREEYLLELVRYVHNNPVRAGVARNARGSAWSSHRAYIGAAEAPEWLRLGYVLGRFGGGGARGREKFDAFVDAGRKESRRPELSGAQDAGEAAAVRRALGDGHRMSDVVVGSERFVERVRADAERVAAAFSSRGRERRAGAVGRPALREVIDAVLELLELDALELTHRPKSRRSSHAKRLITWVWKHEYEGSQIDVARALQMETGAVSRHYSHALTLAAEFDEQAAAVVGLLRKRSRRRHGADGRTRTKATQGGLAVRYHVDVEET